MKNSIEPGTILISKPFIDDEKFDKTIILVVEHNKNGTIGFIINKKTLYSIINQAYQDNKYLIISSLNSIKNIQTKIKDLESRFSSFVDIGIALPTDELIRVILTKNFSDKQIQVSEKNIEYILKNIERSYEKINTFSNSIDSLSLTKAQPIKLHLIKKVLNEISIQ